MEPKPKHGDYSGKPKRTPEKKPEPVYVSTGSFIYRFKDGTHLRLREGVSPLVTGAKLEELKKHKHVREVK